MVVIRLARTGANKRPFYHVVAIDHRRARNSGNYIERLGYFNPIAQGMEVRLHLDHERINHWISKGAQPSERVHGLIEEAQKTASGQTTSVQKRKAKLTEKKAQARKQAALQKEAQVEVQAAEETTAAAEAQGETKTDTDA